MGKAYTWNPITVAIWPPLFQLVCLCATIQTKKDQKKRRELEG